MVATTSAPLSPVPQVAPATAAAGSRFLPAQSRGGLRPRHLFCAPRAQLHVPVPLRGRVVKASANITPTTTFLTSTARSPHCSARIASGSPSRPPASWRPPDEHAHPRTSTGSATPEQMRLNRRSPTSLLEMPLTSNTEALPQQIQRNKCVFPASSKARTSPASACPSAISGMLILGS